MSAAQKMLLETRLNSTACTLPTTVHRKESRRRCRAVPRRQRADSRSAVQVGDRDIGRVGRIDDAVEGFDVDELARADCTQDRFLQ